MDWKNLNADVNKILNVHFSSGRSGRTINKVVIHYNAGNLTVEGCYNLWQSRAASAHYQVESNGRIGQLVWDSDTAWHAGNWDVNCSSIGVEHANNPDGTVTDTCLDAGAHLVAAICLFYKLGRPEWMKNVFPHKHFSATQCPGQLAGSQNAAYMQKAQYWYDQMSGTKPTPQPTPQPAPQPSTKYSVGQHVVFSTCYKSSTAPNSEAINASNMARNHGVITKIASGAKNPYLLDNGLCWVNDGDIRSLYGGSSSSSSSNSLKDGDGYYKVGTPVATNTLATASTGGKVYKGEWQGKITRVVKNTPYPYLLNNGTGWTNDTGIDTCPTIPKV